jgi:hypothetical protein
MKNLFVALHESNCQGKLLEPRMKNARFLKIGKKNRHRVPMPGTSKPCVQFALETERDRELVAHV